MANESSGSSRKPVGQIIARGDRTWLVRIYVGRNPQTGKRQYDNHTVRGTKKGAQTYLNGKLRERDLGTYAGVQHTLIGTLLDDLLANYKINEQDYNWAEGKVRVNLRPFFGAMKAASVGTDQINAYIEKRRQPDTRVYSERKRVYGPATNGTINRELALLRCAYTLGKEGHSAESRSSAVHSHAR